MRRMYTLIVVLLAGCSNELQGSLSAEAEGKQWTTTPDECVSGERQGFFGVDLRAQQRDDQIIRVVLHPTDGPSINVNVPGTDKGVLFNKSSKCANFDLHVERQSSRINNITNVRGHVRVDCDDQGLKLKSDISFANCH